MVSWQVTCSGVAAMCVIVVLAACARRPRGIPPPPPAVTAPAAPSPLVPTQRYTIAAGEVRVRVYRDGPLARLGHNHVVTTTALTGEIELAEPPAASRFLLQLPLDSLQVDLPQERDAAGADFSAPVPQKDREATRRNMLGPDQLDADRHPLLVIRSSALTGGPEHWVARVRLQLRGSEHGLEVPFRLSRSQHEVLVAGSLTIDHAAIGLVPFSVALGALRVRPGIEVDFRLRALPENPPPAGT